MAGLASILIGLAARRSAGRFERAVGDPVETQRRLLAEIMQRNQHTEYGKEHGFSSIATLEDYQKRVPVVNYENIRARIDRMTRGEKQVFTAEDPVLFAQTSGTTGSPKYIPVTPTCRKAGEMTTWLHYARKDHPGMFAGKILTIVSPAIEGWTEGGLPYGSTSGMIVKELPGLVQTAYAVPYDVFEIMDYAAKYYTLLRLGLAERISFIGTANPSSILKLAEIADKEAERLIRDIYDGTLSSEVTVEPKIRSILAPRLRKDPHRARALEKMRKGRDGKLLPADYWPEMALLGCWKGGTVGNYISRLKSWYDPDRRGMVPVRDMGYLASEARMSIPVSDRGAGGVLTVHINVFEFVPTEQLEDNPDDIAAWTFLGLTDLEKGKEYYVFITTSGGLYRYDMNDIIEVVDQYRETPVVEFRRKGRGMTNITGEKLSVNQVIEAMNRAGEATGTKAAHFRAEPDLVQSRYVFKVEFSGAVSRGQAHAFLRSLEKHLGGLNIEYQGKRASARLKPPVLLAMKTGWYERGKQRLVAEGKRLFQAKTIVLDAKARYAAEPAELLLEVHLEES